MGAHEHSGVMSVAQRAPQDVLVCLRDQQPPFLPVLRRYPARFGWIAYDVALRRAIETSTSGDALQAMLRGQQRYAALLGPAAHGRDAL